MKYVKTGGRVVRKIPVSLLTIIALFTFAEGAGGQELGRMYLKFDVGGSYPVLKNLSDELALQGDESIAPGYSFGLSLGSTFLKKRMAAEAWFSVSRYASFRYDNGLEGDFAEQFDGNVTHYGFAAAVKYCFRPASRTYVPWAGVALGYGTTNLVSGGGKIGQFTGTAFLQLEHRIKDNISFLAEAAWIYAFSEDPYTSPFIEASDADRIYDSRGVPLSDSFSSYDFRLGVKIWLKRPRPY
ncbi:MAG TPA: hypothetical protein VLA34_06290 [Candidatus Krumholzibacterium sp.]|nr:hypothetical protein [Candidatus Krumholzibacterium sp.]